MWRGIRAWFSIFDKAAKEFAILLFVGHSLVYII
jgi:hypothetical protein